MSQDKKLYIRNLIDALIEWKKKVPGYDVIEDDDTVYYMRKEYRKELYEILNKNNISDEEKSKIYEESQKAMDNYFELRNLFRQGFFSEQEILECKEANFGGEFGFSTEVESVAKKYRYRAKRSSLYFRTV